MTNNEQEIFIELGNGLLREYCNNTIQDITGLSKSGFRDGLMLAITAKWQLHWRFLPDDETFYRAFRNNKCSSAMREKMAMLYYAKSDEKVGSEMNKIFENISSKQRISLFYYWNRFVNEVTGPANFEIEGPVVQKSDLRLKLEKAQQEIDDMKALLNEALGLAKRKDDIIENQFALLKQQRVADDRRIRQLEHEVQAFIKLKPEGGPELKQAEKYFVSGNYSAYQKVLDNSIKTDAVKIAQTYYLKAKGFEATLQYKNALKAYEVAQYLQPKNPEYLNAMGHFLYLIADYKVAIGVLKKSLALVKKDPALQAKILNNIGEVYHEKDEFDVAIKHFEQSLAINRKLFGDRNDVVARNLNNLGLCWMDKAGYDKAINFYSEALIIRKGVLGNSRPETATILSHWGLALKSKGELNEAIKKYRQAIKIAEKQYGRHHPHVANYLNNIAEVWREQSKNDDAIKYYIEAMDIYKSIFPNGHPRIAGFLNNLGAAWKEKGDFKKGISFYKQSMALNHKLFGKYNVSIGHNLNNLGLAYHGIGDNDKAIESYTEALRVYKKIYRGDHPDIAKVYSNMGGVFHDQKLYKKAVHSYTLAKQMYQKYFSISHISIAYPIANIARVYDACGDYDAAILSYNDALKYFKRTYGDTSVNVAHVYNNLGQTWNSKGNKNNALKYYNKALLLFEKIVGPKNHYTVKCKKELGIIINSPITKVVKMEDKTDSVGNRPYLSKK